MGLKLNLTLFQVQIRPWNLSDSDFVMDGSQPLDPRKTIFVGGVPRPLRASNYTCFVFYFSVLLRKYFRFRLLVHLAIDDQLYV